MSCLWDELPVAALGFSSLLVCVGLLPQGGGFVVAARCPSWDWLLSRKFCPKFDIGVYFVGVVALSLSSVTFDVRPSGMASFLVASICFSFSPL